MTYSVKWMSTNVTFARRFDVYLDYPFFEHQVSINVGSWFSCHISYWNNLFETVVLLVIRNIVCFYVYSWVANAHCHLQIHWFSIFNSFMMVIFLTGLVSMILMRTLRNDYAKYAREDDDLETLVMLYAHCIFIRSLLLLIPSCKQ